jgi:hypothetical protein
MKKTKNKKELEVRHQQTEMIKARIMWIVMDMDGKTFGPFQTADAAGSWALAKIGTDFTVRFLQPPSD